MVWDRRIYQPRPPLTIFTSSLFLQPVPRLRADPLFVRGSGLLRAEADHRLHGFEFLLRVAAKIREAVFKHNDEAKRRGDEEREPEDGA